MKAEQQELVVAAPKSLAERQPTMLDLLQVALSQNAAIDVIERLAALQEKQLARDAETQFNEAMNAAQAEVKRVVPNETNTQTSSKYATYAKLDSVLRPVYLAHGFSLSFTTAECPKPETERILCYVSHRGGHTRTYQKDIPADGAGPKGGAVMSKVHASGSASSYGMRYLLKMIFNVAIGEDDNDGNATNGELMEQLEYIANASDPEELKRLYKDAYQQFEENPAAIKAIVAARKARAKEFE